MLHIILLVFQRDVLKLSCLFHVCVSKFASNLAIDGGGATQPLFDVIFSILLCCLAFKTHFVAEVRPDSWTEFHSSWHAVNQSWDNRQPF